MALSMRSFLDTSFWHGVLYAGAAFVLVLLAMLLNIGPDNRPPVLQNFVRHRHAYDRYVEQICAGQLTKDESGRFPLTDQLQRQRVMAIWAEGDYVFFLHTPHWIDDAYEAMVYALHPKS